MGAGRSRRSPLERSEPCVIQYRSYLPPHFVVRSQRRFDFFRFPTLKSGSDLTNTTPTGSTAGRRISPLAIDATGLTTTSRFRSLNLSSLEPIKQAWQPGPRTS